jgi:hypothetical protein
VLCAVEAGRRANPTDAFATIYFCIAEVISLCGVVAWRTVDPSAGSGGVFCAGSAFATAPFNGDDRSRSGGGGRSHGTFLVIAWAHMTSLVVSWSASLGCRSLR